MSHSWDKQHYVYGETKRKLKGISLKKIILDRSEHKFNFQVKMCVCVWGGYTNLKF